MPAIDHEALLAKLEIPASNRYVSVRPEEGRFMRDWIEQHQLTRSLEVGFAYGASAAWIMSGHAHQHTCMDPMQDGPFENAGLKNLERLGYSDRLDFHAGYSHTILPELLANQRRFDFAFIDGAHWFDSIMLDFYYIDLMLDPGGYILLHDAWMRGTQLVASYVRGNRSDYRRVRTPLRNLILLQKTGEDQRPWHHFREFYTTRGLFSHRFVVWLLNRGWLQRFQ